MRWYWHTGIDIQHEMFRLKVLLVCNIELSSQSTCVIYAISLSSRLSSDSKHSHKYLGTYQGLEHLYSTPNPKTGW